MTHKEDQLPLGGGEVQVKTKAELYRRQSSTTSRLAAVETWVQCRYVLAMMFFFGLMNMYMMRANLSVALLAMVDQSDMHRRANHTEVNCTMYDDGFVLTSDEQSPANLTGNLDKFNEKNKDKFHWPADTRGYILSAFFAGYFTTQILGGYLEHRYGGRLIFGVAVGTSSIISLLTPTLAQQGPYAFIVARVILGLSQGPMYPVHHGMWGKWAPPLARSKLISIAMTGTNIGTALSYNLAAWLAEAYGWESIFYVMGCIGLVWCAFWYLLAFDSPSKHPRISERERRYIENSIGTSKYTKSLPKVPWRAIFTSKLFWGLFIGHFCANYGNYNLLSNLPSYLKQVFKADIKTVAYLSAIPFISVWFFTNIGGQIADKIRKEKWMKTINVRRVLIVMAQFLPAIFLVVVGTLQCNLAAAILMISLAACFGGLSVPGFKVVHIEIAPRYSGILYAITNTFATLSGHLSAVIAGLITESVPDVARGWQIVFWVGAGISVLGGFVVLLTLKTEVQEWAKEDEDFYDDEEKIQEKLDHSNSESGVFSSTTA